MSATEQAPGVMDDREARARDILAEWQRRLGDTSPVDHAVAEEAVREACVALGLPPPETVLWFRSPFAAAIGSTYWDLARHLVDAPRWDGDFCERAEALLREADERLRLRINPSDHLRVRLNLDSSMEDSVALRVIEPLRAALRDRLYESLIGEELARRLPGLERRRAPIVLRDRAMFFAYPPSPAGLGSRSGGASQRTSAPATHAAGSMAAVADVTSTEVARHLLLGVADPYWAQVWREMEAQAGPMVGPPDPPGQPRATTGRWLEDALRAFITKRAERIVDTVLDKTNAGARSISRFATFESDGEFLGAELAARVAKLARVTSVVCWWWPFRTGALLCERPVRLERDADGRLHCATGPAIAYSDGFTVHAWHGVIVPRDVIEDPLTPDQIVAESNTEIRRVQLERYELLRFVSEGGARQVHQDNFGQLYRIESSDAEPGVLVRVTNRTPEPDGTFREYVLRVPPEVRTAREAVAWTFGKSAAEYAPAIET